MAAIVARCPFVIRQPEWPELAISRMILGLTLAADNEATLILSSPPSLVHPAECAIALRRGRDTSSCAGRGLDGGLDRFCKVVYRLRGLL